MIVGAPAPEREGDNVRPDVEHVIGSPGADVLSAAWMSGAAGDDRLLDRPGAQRFTGGDGRDLATYAARSAAVDVDADGEAGDDGSVGEGDAVDADVEDLTGGAGDDRLTGNAGANVLDGGAGDDVLGGLGGVDAVDYSTRTASVEVDLADTAALDGEIDEFDSVGDDVEDIRGGAGDDLLVGSAVSNELAGGAGDVLLDGAAGADTLRGGPGDDAASYASRGSRVVADLDGQAGDDGEAGEGDSLMLDLEALLGGSGPDRLEGNGADNLLDGGRGADELIGSAGFDTVGYASRTAAVAADPDGVANDDGETGEGDTIAADVEDLVGGAGADTLTGSEAANFLLGGPGNDRLDGQGGEDGLFGGDGDDELVTRDGVADLASCDAGDDLARPDSLDELVLCERRDDRPGASPPAAVAPDRRPPTVRVRVVTRRLAQALRRGLRLTVSCSEPCTLSGRLLVTGAQARRLRLASRVIGRASGRVIASRRTVVARLTPMARRRLVRRRAERDVSLLAKDAAGNSRRVSVRVTLR